KLVGHLHSVRRPGNQRRHIDDRHLGKGTELDRSGLGHWLGSCWWWFWCLGVGETEVGEGMRHLQGRKGRWQARRRPDRRPILTHSGPRDAANYISAAVIADTTRRNSHLCLFFVTGHLGANRRQGSLACPVRPFFAPRLSVVPTSRYRRLGAHRAS